MSEFTQQERVYYEDTDAGGVVYHSNYLNFMERCRCEWLRALGFDVAKIQDEQDIMFVVREVKLTYDQPARLFDEITVSARALQVGKVKLVVEQKIYNQSHLSCSAVIKLATLNKTSFTLAAMPAALRSALERDISNAS